MADETTTKQAENPEAGTDAQHATGGGEQPEGKNRTFTQAELDELIKQRLERERKKFADYDAMKERAAKWDEHELAQKSEMEQLQVKLQREQTAREQAERLASERLIRAAFVAEAYKAGAAYPEDAYELANLAQVVVGADGGVAGVAEQVKAIVTAGRLPMRKPIAPELDAGAGGGSRATSKTPEATPEEAEMARRMGISVDQYLKGKTKKKE